MSTATSSLAHLQQKSGRRWRAGQRDWRRDCSCANGVVIAGIISAKRSALWRWSSKSKPNRLIMVRLLSLSPPNYWHHQPFTFGVRRPSTTLLATKASQPNMRNTRNNEITNARYTPSLPHESIKDMHTGSVDCLPTPYKYIPYLVVANRTSMFLMNMFPLYPMSRCLYLMSTSRPETQCCPFPSYSCRLHCEFAVTKSACRLISKC